MPGEREPELLCTRLLDNSVLRGHITSIVWIGSLSRSIDVHKHSDLDVQIILEHHNDAAMIELAGVFADYPDADLSIMYRSDIVDPSGRLDFQDGTKGPFFIQVLADGVVLYGEDVYRSIAASLELDDARPSLMYTIREYVGRLRVMAVRGAEPTHSFKRYSLKLLKDVLVYDAVLPLAAMPSTCNAEVVRLTEVTYALRADALELLTRLVDLDDPFGARERAVILGACEALVQSLRCATT
jgi:hypothetical protein